MSIPNQDDHLQPLGQDVPENVDECIMGSLYADDISLIENYQEKHQGYSRSTISQDYADDISIIENFVEVPKNAAPPLIPAPNSRKRGFTLNGSSESRPSKILKPSHNRDKDQEPIPEVPNGGGAHIIVHCSKLETLMLKFNLARGVRYELARLISRGQINQSDITEDRLKALQGSNEDAGPKIAQIFSHTIPADTIIMDSAFTKELAASSPWKELDIEDRALSKGPYEGLGNNPAMPDWYGGKIQFHGRLQADKKEGKGRTLKLSLDNATLGSSCRFARRFGSWSFLRIKIPENVYYDSSHNLLLFFSKPFIIWDTVFRACYAKGDNVFLYLTNELYPSFQTFEGRLSVEGFIIWHNPLAENAPQLMTKWASRMTLGFSNSVPGPRLQEESILHENDIVSQYDSDMTDGCGLSTRKIHHMILSQLGLPVFPSAFQFRLSGCKGMSLLLDDPEFKDDEKIWVRPSQTKIRYPKGVPLDPAMLTIDLIRTPHMRSGTTLSNDIVINLAENGVPSSVFVDLFRNSLGELVKGLTTWEGPDAMFELWSNVEKVGGVLSGRRAREAVGEARARGYSNRTAEEMELEDDEDEDGITNGWDVPRSVAWWNDQTSGCPSPLEETVMVLLDSGFCPQECPILREKLKQVVIKKIENRTSKLRFDIEQSCTAFVVPDPFGVLGPDEIQIKSSSRNLKLEDGTQNDTIVGDVIIARNPCKNPCDARKVKAVEHPLLRNYVDVIVCSVQGFRRLLDFLAGGDYDGDTGLDLCFEIDKEKVGGFMKHTGLWTSEKRTEAMQAYLLGGLCDPSLVGKYSAMHDATTLTLGYSHPKTVKLNAKFCTILDSAKNGRRIKKETLAADKAAYGNTLGPQWKAMGKKNDKKKTNFTTSNATYATRNPGLPVFIMDILVSAAQKEKTRLMVEMDKVFEPLSDRRPDPQLTAPWLTAQQWASRGTPESVTAKEKDLELIAAHVQTVYKNHKATLSTVGKGGANSFTDLRIESRQDMLRQISREFHSGPSLDLLPNIADNETLRRYRASYAYKYDSEQAYKRWSRFPWDVDMRQLCSIKASALGPYKVVTCNFYERFKLVKGHSN